MRCNKTRPIIKFPISAKCERTNDRSYPDTARFIMSDDKTKASTKRSKTEENVSL